MNEYGRDAEVEDFDLEGNKGLRSVQCFGEEGHGSGVGFRWVRWKVNATATCLADKLQINDALY